MPRSNGSMSKRFTPASPSFACAAGCALADCIPPTLDSILSFDDLLAVTGMYGGASLYSYVFWNPEDSDLPLRLSYELTSFARRQEVPEPGTLALLAIGCLGVLVGQRLRGSAALTVSQSSTLSSAVRCELPLRRAAS